MDDITNQAPETEEEGWEWCFIEIMGHRSHWGRCREVERFGAKMVRVDVPIDGDPVAKGWATHFYGGPSIFSFALTDEQTVLKRNKPYAPPSRYALPAPGTPDDRTEEDEENQENYEAGD